MKKNILIFTIILLMIILSGCVQEKITNLDAPILKTPDKNIVGREATIEASGYPKSKILIFINDEYKYDSEMDKNGNLSYKIIFNEEGNHIVKIKQTYSNITSDFSNKINYNVDLTPPQDTLNIKSSIPGSTNVKELEIFGSITPPANILLNNKSYKTDENGNFSINYKLQEGNNRLSFKLKDEVGNTTGELFKKDIILDTMPPRIQTGYCPINPSQEATEEYVCIKHGDFSGYFPSSFRMPIEGNASGKIKSITLDGKTLVPDENNEIYKKVPLYLNFGTNKFKIIVKDSIGNQSSKYLEINVVKDSDDININLNN